MEGLKTIAAYYHVGIIASVGSSKARPGADYTAQRDKIFGSIAWSRTSETIVLIQYADDDMGKQRILSVLPRNAAPEKYCLVLDGSGRLVLDVLPADDKTTGVAWWKSHRGEWLTVLEYQDQTSATKPTAYRETAKLLKRKVLKAKPKKHKEPRLYSWNEGLNNRENKA